MRTILYRNLTKSKFYNLLSITMLGSFFIFDGKFHGLCDGLAMDSSLEPTLPIVILKTFGWKTVLLISNQLFTDDSWMILFYSLNQRIILKSLKIISTKNIKKLRRKLRKWFAVFLNITISRGNRFRNVG